MRLEYYEKKLYPFQDRVLTVIKETKTPFYLTGRTALSRFYLDHRYSDDLDFFVNYDSSFRKYADIIVNALKKAGSLEILYAADDFFRNGCRLKLPAASCRESSTVRKCAIFRFAR